MQSRQNDIRGNYLIYADVLAIYKYGLDMQWKAIRLDSIHRILYLSSVLFAFRNPDSLNPFNNYKFSIDKTGPYDPRISQSIEFLLKDEYLIRVSGDDVFALGNNSSAEIFKLGIEDERLEWLQQVMYIIGIYGENKVYEFIFRDPEYQTTIKSGTQRVLNTTTTNETVKTLNLFKDAFEETLKNKDKLSTKTYLSLYFEYVFSKILKRED